MSWLPFKPPSLHGNWAKASKMICQRLLCLFSWQLNRKVRCKGRWGTQVDTQIILSERICSQERFFTQTVELVVGAGATHAVFDTPDDDGVAAVLAPEFGDAIES